MINQHTLFLLLIGKKFHKVGLITYVKISNLQHGVCSCCNNSRYKCRARCLHYHYLHRHLLPEEVCIPLHCSVSFTCSQSSFTSLELVPVSLTLYSAKAIVVPHWLIWNWYTGRWWVGCYIWYSEERTGRGRSPPSPLLAVPNVTAHPSTASVPITVLLYNGPLLCGFNVPSKGLSDISIFPVISC